MEIVRFFICCILLVIDVTSILLKKQVGVRLCEDECFHAGGCEGFRFDYVHLQCDLQGDDRGRNLHGSAHMLMYNKLKSSEMRDTKRCAVGERSVRNRKWTRICVKRKVLKPRKKQKRHLLLVPQDSRKFVKFHKLNLDTRVIDEYKFSRVKKVLSMLYMDIAGKLLISTDKPRKIQMYHLNGKTSSVLNTVAASNMALDEGRQLVFYVNSRGCSTIMRVPITKKIKSPHNTRIQGACFTSLAVDISRQILYAIDDESVKSLSYDGKNVNIISRKSGYDRHNLLYDAIGNVLYFANRMTIHMRKLSEKRLSLLSNLMVDVGSFYVYRNEIFVYTYNGKSFKFQVITEKKSHIPIKFEFNSGLIFCGIP